MAGTQIRVNLDDLSRKLGILKDGLKRGLLTELKNWLLKVTRDSFGKQASPEGVPWPQLSARYAAWKAKRKPAASRLQLSGTMLRTLVAEVRDNAAIVSSNLPYASVHQDGFFGFVKVKAHRRRVKSRNVFETVDNPIQGSDFGDLTRRPTRRRRQLVSGVGFVREHFSVVNIPARPFLPSPEFAEQEGAKQAEEIAQEFINEAGAGPA